MYDTCITGKCHYAVNFSDFKVKIDANPIRPAFLYAQLQLSLIISNQSGTT